MASPHLLRDPFFHYYKIVIPAKAGIPRSIEEVAALKVQKSSLQPDSGFRRNDGFVVVGDLEMCSNKGP